MGCKAWTGECAPLLSAGHGMIDIAKLTAQANELEASKQFVESAAIWRTICANAPTSGNLFRHGRACFYAGNFALALEVLKLAEELAPVSYPLLQVAGVSCERLGDLAQAARYAEKMRNHPSNTEFGNLFAARKFLNSGECDRGLELAQQAFEKLPANVIGQLKLSIDASDAQGTWDVSAAMAAAGLRWLSGNPAAAALPAMTQPGFARRLQWRLTGAILSSGDLAQNDWRELVAQELLQFAPAPADATAALKFLAMTGDAITRLIDEAQTSTLSVSGRQSLQKLMRENFGLEIGSHEILMADLLANRIRKIMRGRIATDQPSLLLNFFLNYVAARRVADSSPNARPCEIGVLFGGSLIMARIGQMLAGHKAPILAIDPLVSFYGQDIDPISKDTVSVGAINGNLETCLGSQDGVEIAAARSEDPQILDRISAEVFSILFIDGDHGRDGVRQDWINYAPKVMHGGFAVIDNYLDPAWPGVTDYFMQEVLPTAGKLWRIGAVYSKTLVLERLAPAS